MSPRSRRAAPVPGYVPRTAPTLTGLLQRALVLCLTLLPSACALDWTKDPWGHGLEGDASAADGAITMIGPADGATTMIDAAATGGCDGSACEPVEACVDGGCSESPGGPDGGLESPRTCYPDMDHDGVGAGSAIPCDDAGTERDDDCDDNDPNRSPLQDELCNGKDNNCDGKIDDVNTNACGGSCLTTFATPPGKGCTNGLKGACFRSGKYVCSSLETTSCDAPSVTAGTEICGDNIDNDCDGDIDENRTTFYKDCDGDGYAASTTGSVTACALPAAIAGCKGWTTTLPDPQTRLNWDCKDLDPRYRPDAPFGEPNQLGDPDFNCDGEAEADPVYHGTIAICSGGVLDVLNTKPLDQCGLSNLKCVAWLQPNGGLYAASPPFVCPDAPTLFESFGSGQCTFKDSNPVWYCR